MFPSRIFPVSRHIVPLRQLPIAAIPELRCQLSWIGLTHLDLDDGQAVPDETLSAVETGTGGEIFWICVWPEKPGMKPILLTLYVLCAAGAGGQSPAWPPADSTVGDTLFADCAKLRAHHVVSPVSLSQNSLWRAYVDVDQGSPECLLKSSLWIARANGPYQLAYFIPPARDNEGNGMQILGWMPGPSVVLVRTERWQWGSDAGDIQQVLAIEAPTGRVYEPRLDDILAAHSDKQCWFHVQDAGFASRTSLEILLRVTLATAHDVDETEDDVPPEKRCGDLEEAWNFDYSSAYEAKQVSNQQPLLLFRSPGSIVETSGQPGAAVR